MTTVLRYFSVLFFAPLSMIFASPRKKLQEVMPELLRLRDFLKTVGQPPQRELAEPLLEILRFFDVVSKWHDRGLQFEITAFEAVNFGRHDAVLAKLRQLEALFCRAGRDQRMNRTSRGETVVAEKVYLGNVYDLADRPIPFWIGRKQEKPGLHPECSGANAYDIVLSQARGFMIANASRMVKLIDDLKGLAR